MKDFIDYIMKGQFPVAFVFLLISYLTPKGKELLQKNPRLKWAPFTFFVMTGLILLIYYFTSLTISIIVLASLSLLLFAYFIVININVKYSPERIFLNRLEAKLSRTELDNLSDYYFRYKNYYLTDLGRFKYGEIYLEHAKDKASADVLFHIIEDLESLKLKDIELRKLYLLEFEVYIQFCALRAWKSKYKTIKQILSKEECLYIEAVIAFYELELDKSENAFHELLVITKSEKYKQIAENNIAVIAEYRIETIDWSDYAQKSFTTSLNNINKENASYNLILYYLNNDKREAATKLFKRYIASLSKHTISQKYHILNERLQFYRAIEDKQRINSLICEAYQLYKTAPKKNKLYILNSLLRISLNHDKYLFNEIWSEFLQEQDSLLNLDFSFTMSLTKEIIALAKSTQIDGSSKFLSNFVNKCLKRVYDFDIDLQISKLRNEDVRTRREYIKFKAMLADKDLNEESTEQDYSRALNNRFSILDQLISLDQKQGIGLNTLDSIFLKLDEVVCARDVFKNYYKLPFTSDVINKLNNEAEKLIENAKLILYKVEKAAATIDYHLKLAFYYYCLGNNIESHHHFQLFNNSGQSILHYAEWLRQWYFRLEQHFKDEKIDIVN